jgi:hypothetical protein
VKSLFQVTSEYTRNIKYNNNNIKFVYIYLFLEDSACTGILKGLDFIVEQLFIHLLYSLPFLDVLEQYYILPVDINTASQYCQISVNLWKWLDLANNLYVQKFLHSF